MYLNKILLEIKLKHQQKNMNYFHILWIPPPFHILTILKQGFQNKVSGFKVIHFAHLSY